VFNAPIRGHSAEKLREWGYQAMKEFPDAFSRLYKYGSATDRPTDGVATPISRTV